MNITDAKHLCVPAKAERLEEVVTWLEEQLFNCQMPINQVMKAAVVAEEIFVNICHYAYVPGVGEVDLYLWETETAVQLCFADSGAPFNPLEKPGPNTDLPTEQRKEGGLGIHLIKNLVSSLQYEYTNGQNRLCISMEKGAEK